MVRVGLLSDTHNHLEKSIFPYFEQCDEIWHAGDIGTLKIADQLSKLKPFRAVYGNIDGAEIRTAYPKVQRFKCEEVDVLMTHIGGYPERYNAEVKTVFASNPPQLFVCGHSHILKVMFDKKYNFLHINPGAAGLEGFHKIKTLVRFTIEKSILKDLEVIELGFR